MNILRKDYGDLDFEDFPAPESYAQIILTVDSTGGAEPPLLADPQLAQTVLEAIAAHAAHAPGQLWGYLVLPDSVRLVVGPGSEDAIDAYADAVKARTTERVVAALNRRQDDLLDRVLRYNPIRGGVRVCLWQEGIQRMWLWSEAKLSHALYRLHEAPVQAGLAEQPGEWPFANRTA